MEELVNVLLQFSAFGSILASHLIGFLQFVLHNGRILVYLKLVPSLLQKVGSVVVASVSVAESNILDVVTHERFLAGREIVYGIVHEQRMSAHKNIYQHGFSTTISSHDGDMFALAGCKVDRLCHSPFWHTGHAILNLDNCLHFCLILMFPESSQEFGLRAC